MNAQVAQAMSQLYAREGEAATHSRCAEWRLIASVCMTCAEVYRIRNADGGNGGLSHGWCSDACARAGAERTGLSHRLASS